MINKKLLQQVLSDDYEILKITKFFIRIRHIEAFTYTEWCEHKVAHACKQWAFNLGYFIDTKALSSKLRSREYGSKTLDECFNTNWDNGKPYDPICDIKVCEWIIENDEAFLSET
jgi:hypothetical protein